MKTINDIIFWILVVLFIVVMVGACARCTVLMTNYKVCTLYGYDDVTFILDSRGGTVVCTKTIVTPLDELIDK